MSDDTMSDPVNTTRRPQKGELRRWSPAILAVLVVAFYYLSTRPTPALQGWMTEFVPAQAEATATNRNMLVQFTLPGCPPCVAMKRTVLSQGPVIQALNDFVPVNIDASKEPELAARYGVFTAPAYAVVDATGTLLAKVDGFVQVDEFVAFLERARQLKGEAPPLSVEAATAKADGSPGDS